MAISIDREILAEEQKEVSLEIESERLRSNLLRAISHDLRTPLAGISGAISTIIKNKNLIGEEVVDDLLNGVFEDTQWLIRLVENLLSMTRIDEGRLEVKKIQK
ncbi:his Kinase A domain protein [[Clostridium] sordellii ATCC 9714]|nr:his Kinase A domain protein [[Clostridium] sordellii ATCC 9714] [Paeniclostridium sordellii ATCC 9714]